MDYTELISAFAERHAIAGCDASEGKAVTLQIDDMTVTLLHDETEARLLICGEIGQPSADGAAAFAQMMLKANFSAPDMVFAQNPETDAYALICPKALDALDVNALDAAFEAFANQLETWRTMLADFRVIAAEQPDAAASVAPVDGIRV